MGIKLPDATQFPRIDARRKQVWRKAHEHACHEGYEIEALGAS
jgi:hypothetical protein